MFLGRAGRKEKEMSRCKQSVPKEEKKERKKGGGKMNQVGPSREKTIARDLPEPATPRVRKKGG